MFAEILGTVASETKIGATDDLLPPIFFASNIRQNPAFKNATGTTILKVSDLEKEKALSSADSSSRSKNTGITSETVDFLIYSVEGVLNVAQKAYNYIVD